MILVTIVLTAGLVATWGLIVYSRAERLNNWLTLEQISERVRTDLPVGTPLPEVEEYFESSHIEHSYVARTNEVYAMVHRIWGGTLLFQRDAWIRIELDSDKRLKQINVEPISTGP